MRQVIVFSQVVRTFYLFVLKFRLQNILRKYNFITVVPFQIHAFKPTHFCFRIIYDINLYVYLQTCVNVKALKLLDINSQISFLSSHARLNYASRVA